MISVSMASSFFLTQKTKYKFFIPKIFHELQRKARSLIIKRISRRLVKQSKNRIESIGHRFPKLHIEPAISGMSGTFVLSSHTIASMPPSWFPISTTPSMITWHFARRMAQRQKSLTKAALTCASNTHRRDAINAITHKQSLNSFIEAAVEENLRRLPNDLRTAHIEIP